MKFCEVPALAVDAGDARFCEVVTRHQWGEHNPAEELTCMVYRVCMVCLNALRAPEHDLSVEHIGKNPRKWCLAAKAGPKQTMRTM
jgi:hypothetical protein